MRLLIATILLLMGVCVSAQTIPTSEQVEELIQYGRVAEAKVALQQVLAVKPKSPKANYYMAQLVQMENGDTFQYQPFYKPYLNKIAIEKAKAEEAEKVRQVEQSKSFLKFLVSLVVFILILIFGAMFVPDIISNYKEKKRNQEKEKLRLEYNENKRIELLKEALSINDQLLVNIYSNEDKANEHKNFALDAIEILSKKGDFDLKLIEKWVSDVKIFMTIYRSSTT